MHRIRTLLAVLVVCFSTNMQTQGPTAKLDPEVKKLHAVLGSWTYEGEAKAGPGCLGGKVTGEMTCQMIIEGAFLQCRIMEKNPAGETLEIDGYDPVTKNFTHDSYHEDGSRISGVLTINGRTWTYESKLRWLTFDAGKEYQYKGTFVLAPDLASGTFTDEISSDGKTWTTCEESKYTKVKPAA